MKNKLLIALIGAFLVLAITISCGGGGSSNNNNNNNNNNNPPVTTDRASAPVTSTTSGIVTTPGGAAVNVPVGAVPLTGNGQTGTMVFSAEKTTTVTATPPAGEAVASDVYQFGPDGFTFAAPVKVTIPVPNASNSSVVNIYRIDQTAHVARRFPGTYDPATHTISAYTDQLSPWFATTSGSNSTADGAVRLVNNSSNKWLKACVDTYSLTYPAGGGGNVFGEASAAPLGTIGWNSTIPWGLPQGTYKICLSMHTSGTETDLSHWFVSGVNVNQASVYPNFATSQDFTYGGAPSGSLSGACACTPTPTPSAGTGDVQITLTWHVASPGVDLDLHVFEPSGEEIYFSHTTSATGGTLDRDNRCGNYEDGHPENVFWPTGGAPHGSYTVKVVWFGDCGTGSSSLGFDVRVINKGTVTTYPGTITPGQHTVTAATFTVQ